MSSTLLKVSRPVYPKPKIAPPAPLLPATPNPEDCFFNFVQALRNIGEFPTHWLNNFRIQASDLSLVRTLRVGGDKGLICVMRTSPRLENFLQENANPLVRGGRAPFRPARCGIHSKDGPLLPGDGPEGGPRDPARHPQGLAKRRTRRGLQGAGGRDLRRNPALSGTPHPAVT